MATSSPRLSAGILLYRRRPGSEDVEVALGHPGGPFFARKDDGVWSIPKGLCEPGSDVDQLAAAVREFTEEVGQPAAARALPRARLGEAGQRQDRRRMGGRGRPRPGHGPQQHLRAGVAAADRPAADLSRNRPGGVVHHRAGPGQAQPGPGRRFWIACSTRSAPAEADLSRPRRSGTAARAGDTPELPRFVVSTTSAARHPHPTGRAERGRGPRPYRVGPDERGRYPDQPHDESDRPQQRVHRVQRAAVRAISPASSPPVAGRTVCSAA